MWIPYYRIQRAYSYELNIDSYYSCFVATAAADGRRIHVREEVCNKIREQPEEPALAIPRVV